MPTKSKAPASVKKTKRDIARRKELARKRRRRRLVRRAIGRFFLSLFTLIALVLVAVFGACTVLAYGPSGTLSDWLVMSTLESSAAKFVGYIYFTDEEVEAIKARNSVQESSDDIDTSLVVIEPQASDNTPTAEDAVPEQEIEIVPVTGATYNGYMMVVRDPSRVSVGTSTGLGNKAGMRLAEIAEKYEAIGAINGGGFLDTNGMGDGGSPIGLVYSQGECVWRKGGGDNNLVIGLTTDNKLVFGSKMSATTAAEKHIRDCVAFGPALVKNGNPVDVSGAGSGLNPRSAIGQRSDGAILLLVINGRKVNSLGASYADLIQIMLDFGAVNAANLDGGTSSFMYYDGELINDKASLYGTRKIPTAWIVK